MFEIQYTPDGLEILSCLQTKFLESYKYLTLNLSLLLWNPTFANSLFLHSMCCVIAMVFTSISPTPSVVPFLAPKIVKLEGVFSSTTSWGIPLRYPFTVTIQIQRM